MAPCLEQYGVTWMRSYFSSDRRRMICHYEAPDAEAVRASNRAAGALFEQVWSAEGLWAVGGDFPEGLVPPLVAALQRWDRPMRRDLLRGLQEQAEMPPAGLLRRAARLLAECESVAAQVALSKRS